MIKILKLEVPVIETRVRNLALLQTYIRKALFEWSSFELELVPISAWYVTMSSENVSQSIFTGPVKVEINKIPIPKKNITISYSYNNDDMIFYIDWKCYGKEKWKSFLKHNSICNKIIFTLLWYTIHESHIPHFRTNRQKRPYIRKQNSQVDNN